MDQVLSLPYRPKDFSACLSIFDGNAPRYFSPEERVEFIQFLGTIDHAANPYLVLTLNGSVVACGGLSINAATRTASLSWGMVNEAYHRCGFGTRLTEERLNLARSLPDLVEVTLATSQHTYEFYERHGFKVARITADGFAEDLDRYDMTLRLA
ncbi:MAG: GNAT family N-acetyltransferase [Agrobacterium albertimagni]